MVLVGGLEQEVSHPALGLALAFLSWVRLGVPPFLGTQIQYPARVKGTQEMYSSWAVQCLSVDWVYHHRSRQSQRSQAVRLCLEVQIEGVC